MNAKVTWQKELQFVGMADSGFPVKLDSHSSPETGVGHGCDFDFGQEENGRDQL
jgi:hypothetical protein